MAGASVLVTFLVAHRIWNAGETAGFAEIVAAELIAAGIAAPADDAGAAAKAPEPEPEPKPKPAKGKPVSVAEPEAV
jgi:hypothetical protein